MATQHCNGHLDCFVKNLSISSNGLSLKSKWLAPYNFTEGGEASMLLLPDYLVITTQPSLRQQMVAIQELQFRQDELKQDFSYAIRRLAQDFKHRGVNEENSGYPKNDNFQRNADG